MKLVSVAAGQGKKYSFAYDRVMYRPDPLVKSVQRSVKEYVRAMIHPIGFIIEDQVDARSIVVGGEDYEINTEIVGLLPIRGA